jgi:superfamily II DNA or RNA helicase
MIERDKIEIVVDNRLRIRLAGLPDNACEQICQLFTHRNPQHYKLKRMGFKAWKEPAVLKTWQTEAVNGEQWLSLPRGGMRRLRGALSELGLGWLVLDHRVVGDKEAVGWADSFPEHNVELWEHQERIVNGIINTQNCVVRSATGSGKTTALLCAISRIQLPALVVVWETGLLKQWLERIERELGLSGDDVGIIGGGKFRLRPITMAMQQSLNALNHQKWDLVSRSFGFLGADELNRFAASTFNKTINRFPAKYRVGMSAVEKRKDGKEFLIYDLFGGIGADVGSAELVEAGIVHDVEIRIVPTDFRADWYAAQHADGKQVPDFHRLLEEMLADKHRNALIASVVAQATEGGRQALVFSHRVEHCRRLDSVFAGLGLRSGIMVGEDGESYSATVFGLRNGSKQIGIGTFGKIGLGLDLPAVAAGVIATPCHNNWPLWVQVTGRLSRVADGKTEAVLWYLWDRHVHGLHPIYNLRRWSKLVRVMDDDHGWMEASDYLGGMKLQRTLL